MALTRRMGVLMMTVAVPRISGVFERGHCLPLRTLHPSIRSSARPNCSKFIARSAGMERLNELLVKNKCSNRRHLPFEASQPYRSVSGPGMTLRGLKRKTTSRAMHMVNGPTFSGSAAPIRESW